MDPTMMGMGPPPGMTPPGMPGMAPPMPPMGMAPPPPQGGLITDPRELMAALAALAAKAPAEPTARYPRWYKRPPKPDPKGLMERSTPRKNDFAEVRKQYDEDLQRLRLNMAGVFPEDLEERMAGSQEDFVSTALVDEFHLAVAFIAGIELTFEKKTYDERAQTAAQQIKDAVYHLRAEERIRHAEAGYGDLPHDEAKHFLTYGQIVNRTVIDLDDPDFPFDSALLDPATVYPSWQGKRGLRDVYRVYRTTLANLVGDYGDLTPTARKRLANDHGSALDDRTEVEVVEYWDTWWRSVLVGEAVIVPVTAHEYGYVPYTIQYGPLGESRATGGVGSVSLPTRDGSTVEYSEGSLQNDLKYRSLGYIHFRKRSHDIYEATMARMLTGFKKQINPPLMLERDDVAAEKPMPEIATYAGAVNEFQLGRERLAVVPVQQGGMEANTLLQAISTDRLTGSMPLAAYGVNDKSNVSGTAIGALTESGLDKVSPWVRGMELYQGRKYGQWLQSWRNFGHLAAYAGEDADAPRPFVVPVRRPAAGQAPAFALTRDAIDLAGPRVEARLVRTRREQWLPLLNAAQIMLTLGLSNKREVREQFLGLPEYEREAEEWREDRALDTIMADPNFVKVALAPSLLLSEMEEAKDDPDRLAWLQAMYEQWQQLIAQPGAQQAAMQHQQAMQPPQQPGAPQGNPNTSAGVSFPELGQGPGSVTGVQGGPQGPMPPDAGGVQMQGTEP